MCLLDSPLVCESDHIPTLTLITPKNRGIEKYKMSYCHKYGRDENVAKAITFASKEAGSKEQLDAAIESGEVQVFVDPQTGTNFYKWRTMVAGQESGSKDVTKIGGAQRITRAMMDEANKEIDDMNWQFLEHFDVFRVKASGIEFHRLTVTCSRISRIASS